MAELIPIFNINDTPEITLSSIKEKRSEFLKMVMRDIQIEQKIEADIIIKQLCDEICDDLQQTKYGLLTVKKSSN